MTGVLRAGPGSGVVYLDLKMDDEGQREYTVRYLIQSNVKSKTTHFGDGPKVIATTPGLPLIGTPYRFGYDFDLWAYRTPYAKATPYKSKNDRVEYWLLEHKYSTRPRSRDSCSVAEIGDPILEPQRTSGSFQNDSKEVSSDKDGNLIRSSSHERIHGAQVEFDFARPTVVIQQNVINLQLDLISKLINTVNKVDLWGLGERKIKLSNVTWERMLNGICYYYYSRTFEFHIDFDTFDRTDIMDDGTKVLKGHWENPKTAPWWKVDANMNADKPQDYMRAIDVPGNLMNVLLNGEGMPLKDDEDPVPIPLINDSGGPKAVAYYPDTIDWNNNPTTPVDYWFLLGVPKTL